VLLTDRRSQPSRWRTIAAIEVGLAAGAVVLDVIVPTIAILGLVAASLALRREHLLTLGLRRLADPARTALAVLVLVVAWTLFQLAVVMPVLNHLTGTRQDLSELADVEGSPGLLAVFLMLTWTVAAFGEEIVYRGYIPTRITDAVGRTGAGLAVAAVGSSLLFGLAHTEQGVIGVVVTFLDGLFFTALRLRYRSLWAAILAHGFNNTIGLVALFLVGPVYGLW
jgi:membrane protease YdiL (CAAX protease family)